MTTKKLYVEDRSTFAFVCKTVDTEGLDYSFRAYSDFQEVKDPKFHALRGAYERAADELEEYIYARRNEEEKQT